MALYQALSQLNTINVPYIVDTPFARIDKEHRSKILEEFFKELNIFNREDIIYKI